MSVGMAEDLVLSYLSKIALESGQLDVNVACHNSPKNVRLSGDLAHTNIVKSVLDKEENSCTKVAC